MELFKRDDRWDLYNEDGHKIASTLQGCINKLSIKNCQAIKLGYDLDEMATEYAKKRKELDISYANGLYYGFIAGFEKRNEMLYEINNKPDPKLIDSMCFRYRQDFGLIEDENMKKGLRTIMTQLWEEVVGFGFYKDNNKWDVEIEMRSNIDELRESGEGFLNNNNIYIPNLDNDGCLILKVK